MAEADRIRWQCRRGLLELDLVLARFLDRQWENLTISQRTAFQRLLEWPDNDLWDFVTGKRTPTDQGSAELIKLFE